MSGDFAALQHRLLKLASQFDGPARKRILAVLEKPIEADITRAVRGDLGDSSMSGWRRGAPIAVEGEVRVTQDALVAGPARRSFGPMRVLDRGRNQGGASGMHGPGVSADGTTRRTKSGGVAKVRARRGRRWNGRTRAKHTWDDATDLMVRTAPRELEKAIVKEVRGVVGRG